MNSEQRVPAQLVKYAGEFYLIDPNHDRHGYARITRVSKIAPRGFDRESNTFFDLEHVNGEFVLSQRIPDSKDIRHLLMLTKPQDVPTAKRIIGHAFTDLADDVVDAYVAGYFAKSDRR